DTGSEKFKRLLRQNPLQRVQSKLNLSRPIFQVQRHRIDNEHAILRSPLPGFNAKQIVLKRLGLELPQPEICSVCIGLEKFLFVFLEGIKFIISSNQKAVNTCLTVGWKSRVPEKLRELSGGASAQRIHLKETVLGMNKPGSIGNIFSVL